jgi:hypothetical protein
MAAKVKLYEVLFGLNKGAQGPITPDKQDKNKCYIHLKDAVLNISKSAIKKV